MYLQFFQQSTRCLQFRESEKGDVRAEHAQPFCAAKTGLPISLTPDEALRSNCFSAKPA